MYVCLHIKGLLVSSDFNQYWNVHRKFSKTNIKLHWFPRCYMYADRERDCEQGMGQECLAKLMGVRFRFHHQQVKKQLSCGCL